MDIVAVILGMLVVLALGILAVALAGSNRGSVGIIGLLALIFAFSVGAAVGEISSHLPKVENRCRGSIEFSWETQDYIVNEFRDELLKHAECDVSITKGKQPPPFPESPPTATPTPKR